MWDVAYANDVHGMCDTVTPDGVALPCTSNGAVWYDTTWLGDS
jgi:hypothetical protein